MKSVGGSRVEHVRKRVKTPMAFVPQWIKGSSLYGTDQIDQIID